MRPLQSPTLSSTKLRQLLWHKTIPIRCYFGTARVFLPRHPALLPRSPKDTSIRHLLSRRFNSNKPQFNPTQNLGSPEPSLSLSQRLRKLSREYGWSALGVYLLLTALDFPFCFLAVRWLGTDRIGRWESAILDAFWSIIPFQLEPLRGSQASESASTEKNPEEYRVAGPSADAIGVPIYDHGLKEAEQRNRSENATLAYAIHKSFIFVRVPLTAAVTPKVVKTLRGWGWDVGKRRPKNIQAAGKS
ncbi:MAG: hypothetical protein Q9214_003058 [Letrouitia sp. 1 TL-2023]